MGEGTGVGAEQGHRGIATRLVSPQCLTVWVVTGLRRQPGTCYYRDSRCREGGRGAGASGGGLMGLEKAQGCIPD